MEDLFRRQSPLSPIIHVPDRLRDSAREAVDLIQTGDYPTLGSKYKEIADSFVTGETDLATLQAWGNTQHYELDRLRTGAGACKAMQLRYLVLGGEFTWTHRSILDQSVWDLID